MSCPICSAPAGFHESDCGRLRVPADWRRIQLVVFDGRLAIVDWVDGAQKGHQTTARLRHTRQAINGEVPVRPPEWATLQIPAQV